jgi:hypothetical protein
MDADSILIWEAYQSSMLYHVTTTKNLDKIKKDGLKNFQTTNWVKSGSKERYGEGQIYAFSHLADAAKWAAKMDWEFHQEMGSGKIAILELKNSEGWQVDPAQDESIEAVGAKGDWLRRFKPVPPSEIVNVIILRQDNLRQLLSA